MNPSTELRLQTMMRAMTESIIPAIDPANSLAQEQAKLLLGHMDAMIQQQGKESEQEKLELYALTALGAELVSLADGGEHTKACAGAVSSAIEEGNAASLSLAIEQLIIADDSNDTFKEASRVPVLSYAGEATARGREWFKPMGF